MACLYRHTGSYQLARESVEANQTGVSMRLESSHLNLLSALIILCTLSNHASATSLSRLGVKFTAQPADASAFQSDAKLSPTVVGTLSDAAALYNNEKYDDALKALETAKTTPTNSSYETYKINDLLIAVAISAEDYDKALDGVEENAASAELQEKDKQKLYTFAMTLNAKQDRSWRAIQYGEMMARTHLLNAENARELAQIYYITEDYPDAERVAQDAINAGGMSEDERKELHDVLVDSQKEQGKIPAGSGHQLALGLLAAFGSALQQSNGQQQTITYDSNQEMAARQAESVKNAAKAQQDAATEVLAADSAFERAVYRDLTERKQHLSKKEENQALKYFASAFTFTQKDDYASAEAGFLKGLEIDPSNGQANYFYAECLARRGATMQVVDYLTRAMIFGVNSEDGQTAQTALKGLASPDSSAPQN